MMLFPSCRILISLLTFFLIRQAHSKPTTSSHFEWLQRCLARTQLSFSTNSTGVCSRPCGLIPFTDYLPWTHQPVCVKARSEEDQREHSFCLYTNADFRDGRGFSIITTADVGTYISEQPIMWDRERWRKKTITFKDQPYKMEDMAERGLGLRANQTITYGRVFMESSPTIVVIRSALDFMTREQRHYMFRRAIKQLPVKTGNMILKLAKSMGGDELDDVFKTNGIGQIYGEDIRHLSILPEVARINHDCRPNSAYRFDDTTLKHEVFAIRDIKPGEEITVTYVPPEMPSDMRNSLLRNQWNFDCTCSLCAAQDFTLATSDTRLRTIQEYASDLASVSNDPELFLEKVERILELYELEDIIAPKARYLELAAYACSQLGLEAATKKYAKKAYDMWDVIAGKDSWEKKGMGALLRDPKAHPSWKYGQGEKQNESASEDPTELGNGNASELFSEVLEPTKE
ncbi:SET domain-containing protein [Patellaria atrata CBS 101060]|uniref:SET domain-containing protein n=1 Tax=Patellaria atrata CBS 101060 TaxID=1346257 RepID=A0A9P4VRA3_9PEZI|nr:SET domain-containing protein [Patellaria atrata CBS 101060]